MITFNFQVGASETPLTSSDFTQLSHQDQIRFVKDLRNIASEFALKSNLFADINKQERTIASEDNGVVERVYKASSSFEVSLMGYENFKKLYVQKNGVMTDGDYKEAQLTLTMLMGELLNLKDSSGKNRAAERQKIITRYLEISRELKSKYSPPPSVQDYLQKNETIFRRIADEPPAPAPVSRPSMNTQIRQAEKAPSQQRPRVEPKNQTASEEYSACMYAGFILKGSVCRAPRKLDSTFSLLSPEEQKKFVCAEANQLICNPLLFGFQTECDLKKESIQKCLQTGTPVCINPAADATTQCREKTKSDRYYELAVAMIQADPKMLDNYLKEFAELCDPQNLNKNKIIYRTSRGLKRKNSENIRTDIEKTCSIAKPRLLEIQSKYKAKLDKKTAPQQGNTVNRATTEGKK